MVASKRAAPQVRRSNEQPLSGQPFFVQGEWDRVEGAGDSKNIAAFIPRGAGAEDRKQAESIVTLAAAARTYYAVCWVRPQKFPYGWFLYGAVRASATAHNSARARGLSPFEAGFRYRKAGGRIGVASMGRWSVCGAWRGRWIVAGCLASVFSNALHRKTVWPKCGTGRTVAGTLLAYSTVAKKDGTARWRDPTRSSRMGAADRGAAATTESAPRPTRGLASG